MNAKAFATPSFKVSQKLLTIDARFESGELRNEICFPLCGFW